MSKHTVQGPVGGLEAELWLPHDGAAPRALAIMCHPHPLHGGTMQNTVVFRAARGMQNAGAAVLRFNFRGVGASEGVHDGEGGEEDDARAAIDWMVERFGDGLREQLEAWVDPASGTGDDVLMGNEDDDTLWGGGEDDVSNGHGENVEDVCGSTDTQYNCEDDITSEPSECTSLGS